MEHNHNGTILSFPVKRSLKPTDVTIKVRSHNSRHLMRAAQAVFQHNPAVNVNTLGDNKYADLRDRVRSQARWCVSDTNYNILQAHEGDRSPLEGNITYATFAYSLLSELREYTRLKALQGEKEFIELADALDMAVGHACDALFEMEHRS